LATALDAARRAYTDSRYAEVTRTLPTLLAGAACRLRQGHRIAPRNHRRDDRPRYGLASSVLTEYGDDATA
jgi:hypothetical protein